MQVPTIQLSEPERIADLFEYGILDTEPEEDFDSIVRLAAGICDAPMAAISFVDSERQWFKARYGISIAGTARDKSICTHTLLREDIYIINDAFEQELPGYFPNGVIGGGIRFYAGIALRSHRGNPIGTLCVMDTRPRDLDAHQRLALAVLGRQVCTLLENLRIGTRMKRFREVQGRMLDLLRKDVRSPLGTTGTFLQLLDNEVTDHGTPPGVTALATRQFGETLAVFDTLLEWADVLMMDQWRNWLVTDTQLLIRELFADFKQGAAGRCFTLIDRHVAIEPRPLPDIQLSFVLKMVLFCLCEVTQEGEIVVQRLAIEGERLIMSLKLRSVSFFTRLAFKIENEAYGKERPARKSPSDGLYLLLARDVLREFDGDLLLKAGTGVVEAVVEMDLKRGERRN